MRKIPDPKLDDDPKSAIADWKEDPATVLESVDEQLAEFGLEVVMYETGTDTYEWRIEPRDGG